ncbi:MAG: hypothetical protein V4677_11855 [Bacteroidota bacterium]
MKVTLIFLLAFTLSLKAQDSLSVSEDYDLPLSNPRPYEVGYLFLGLNSYQPRLFSPPGVSYFEFLNGILAKYKYKKLSLRFHASYLYKKTTLQFALPSTRDFGNATVKDYKIGTGLQYSLVKKYDYIYTFADLSYRKRAVTANIVTSLYQTNIVSKLNGMNMVVGIGSKLKLYKNLYLTLETGYDQTYLVGKSKYSSYNSEQEFRQETLSYGNLFTRLYFTLTF